MGATLFKVVAVSKNTNSFGLHGMVLIARTGEAWEVGVNQLGVREVGHFVPDERINGARCVEDSRKFHGFNYEIPRRLPDAPPNVVEEVWK